jgi:alkylhydroperoxidase family enzyme
VTDALSQGLALLPEVRDRWREFEATVWSGPLDPELLEVCRIRIATLLRDTEGAARLTSSAVDAGLTAEVIEALSNWPVSPTFGPRERAALAITELFVIDPHAVTDETCATLLEHFTSAEATALTMAVAFFDATSRARVALSATEQE